MNIVFLHCHFERGGVTQVVENQIASIAARIDGKLFLASGGRNGGLSAQTLKAAQTLVIKDLDYDVVRKTSDSSTRDDSAAAPIVADLVGQLSNHDVNFGDTILHWHNHSLGKNVSLPDAIYPFLDRDGFKQLLQIHDFAEDYRPENFVRLINQAVIGRAASPAEVTEYCIPNTAGIHYATLTRADAELLDSVGLPSERRHVLPNSVSLGNEALPDHATSLDKIRRAAKLPTDARWCVYPVRGIRRKNVGEFLLAFTSVAERNFCRAHARTNH